VEPIEDGQTVAHSTRLHREEQNEDLVEDRVGPVARSTERTGGDGLKNQAPAGDDELDGDGAAGGRDATGASPGAAPA
jgi:hypothetical protein